MLVRDPKGKFKTATFCCTALTVPAEPVMAWYGLRWNVEVTFEDCRAHLGLETQRQCSDRASARTTPALLGLYARLVLLTHPHHAEPQAAHSLCGLVQQA